MRFQQSGPCPAWYKRCGAIHTKWSVPEDLGSSPKTLYTCMPNKGPSCKIPANVPEPPPTTPQDAHVYGPAGPCVVQHPHLFKKCLKHSSLDLSSLPKYVVLSKAVQSRQSKQGRSQPRAQSQRRLCSVLPNGSHRPADQEGVSSSGCLQVYEGSMAPPLHR